jgi:hypothetical protein
MPLYAEEPPAARAGNQLCGPSNGRYRGVLKGGRAASLIFQGEGKGACSRSAQAKGRPASTLVSCLVQPCGCNRITKKAVQMRRRGSTGPESSAKEEEKIF